VISIGATAILEKGLVLTRNHKDFPSPFFTPKKFMVLPIQHKRYTEHMDLALYEPNIELIARRINEKDNANK
jgi:hypothetical protein